MEEPCTVVVVEITPEAEAEKSVEPVITPNNLSHWNLAYSRNHNISHGFKC